ncbi:MAG: adenosylcobinamide-phosphate synthase CbiB, partial [Candidatus Binataceae bacterium]
MSYAFHLSIPLLAAALALDLLLGDPRWLPHPVRAIGMLIEHGERLIRTGDPRRDLVRGAILTAGVVGISVIAAWAIVTFANWIHPVAGALAAVVIAWTTLALRGLDQAAGAVEDALAASDDAAARRAIPALVGRDPDALDRAGMAQACVESVAENASDGVIAPLVYLFAGGPIAAIAYKAINTLDSMIGYRDARYLYFGRAAARLDDLVNWIPARLTAICIALAAQLTAARAREAVSTVLADARSDASPNA